MDLRLDPTLVLAETAIELERLVRAAGRGTVGTIGEIEVDPGLINAVAAEVRFSLDAREAPAGVIRELARLVREFPGESPVYLSLDTSEGPKTYALGPEYRVRPDPDFIAEARAVLGGSAVLS